MSRSNAWRVGPAAIGAVRTVCNGRWLITNGGRHSGRQKGEVEDLALSESPTWGLEKEFRST